MNKISSAKGCATIELLPMEPGVMDSGARGSHCLRMGSIKLSHTREGAVDLYCNLQIGKTGCCVHHTPMLLIALAINLSTLASSCWFLAEKHQATFCPPGYNKADCLLALRRLPTHNRVAVCEDMQPSGCPWGLGERLHVGNSRILLPKQHRLLSTCRALSQVKAPTHILVEFLRATTPPATCRTTSAWLEPRVSHFGVA